MIKLRPKYLARYAQIARLLIKYGRHDLVSQSNLTYDESDMSEKDTGKPEELAHDLEQLGPTFVKLGQLLSTRPDILPRPYLEALEELQDDVEPVDVAEIREIIESELGVRISNAFESFDDRPLAAASVAQVHVGVLRSGEKVAVKVIRPGIRESVVDDLAAIKELALALDHNTDFGKKYGFLGIAESLERTMLRELDLRLECQSTIRLGEILDEYPLISVARVHEDMCSASVLTMQRVSGVKITEISPAVLLELDGQGLARELFDAYLRQVLIEGFFHADPHPGNLFLTHEHTITLIDCGMVANVDPNARGHMINLLLAISEGRTEEAALCAEKLSNKRSTYDSELFREDLRRVMAEHRDESLERMQVGRILMSLLSAAGESGLIVRHEMLMLGKALMNLDKVVEVLDPKFDPATALKEKSTKIVQEHSMEDVSLQNLFRSALETTELIQQLPARANRFSELLAENKIKITADAVDEEHLVHGMQHIANRITMGMLLAALIVGASLMMRIDTDFTLFGYPGIAMWVFIIAGVAAILLILRMALTNHRRNT